MNKTERNLEIIKKAKQGATLQALAFEYDMTTSNVSVIINKEGYRKCEIVNDIKAGNKIERKYK